MNENFFLHLGITCTLALGVFAVTFYLLYRGQKKLVSIWKNIAEKRERECRLWRERDFSQRLRLIAMARKYRDISLEKGEEGE